MNFSRPLSRIPLFLSTYFAKIVPQNYKIHQNKEELFLRDTANQTKMATSFFNAFEEYKTYYEKDLVPVGGNIDTEEEVIDFGFSEEVITEDDVVFRDENEYVEERMVRFRTVGDMSCTAAVLSDAETIEKVVQEIRESTISERGARIDDKRSEAAMENRKKQGYF